MDSVGWAGIQSGEEFVKKLPIEPHSQRDRMVCPYVGGTLTLSARKASVPGHTRSSRPLRPAVRWHAWRPDASNCLAGFGVVDTAQCFLTERRNATSCEARNDAERHGHGLTRNIAKPREATNGAKGHRYFRSKDATGGSWPYY